MLIDLQLHSTYSDGYLTPTQIAGFIAKHGVKVAALTDHNTVGGLYEFRNACQKYNIKPITGIELYVKLGNKKFNLLWYNFDDKRPELHNLLRQTQIRRRETVRKILNNLKDNGFKIDINKFLDKHTHYVPINHLVDELWANSSNRIKIKKELSLKNPREEDIIMKVLKNKSFSILRENRVDINRVLKLREEIGGQLIFNHPGKHGYVRREFLEKLKKIGIDGIEVLSPHHSIGAVTFFQYIADEMKFIPTGGSDFHRSEGVKYPLQNSWDYYKIDAKYLKGVEKIIGV
jgi:predicted metal-dependent phosphoesterase TrpH